MIETKDGDRIEAHAQPGGGLVGIAAMVLDGARMVMVPLTVAEARDLRREIDEAIDTAEGATYCPRCRARTVTPPGSLISGAPTHLCES